MKIKCIPVGMIQENCYVVVNTATKEALIVDPGDWAEQISALLIEEEVTPVAILLTHGHFDHIGAVQSLREEYHIPVYADEKEEAVLSNTRLSMASFTLSADTYLQDGQELVLAGFAIKVIETPGHTPGGCCYYFPDHKVLFSGDTLFLESVGRTDFPGGSMSALIRAIKDKIFCLPDDVVVYPGHMEETSIGHEKQYNVFVA
ncbi:MAG: MBL fold metallo-hydrolase [Lachnospiraceae bacterium]|jgi:glyoxylase-like metal-dependent hydrolase (beta-lactamase superfamily II)|nr:MBL fold metallo-hydrolase [Lachnospiraceae bacterium]